MATADLLLELMFSWIEKRERCAKQLNKLADELESLRQKCNAGECVGSSVAVVGAACLIGAGLTVLTGGAAAPFLGTLGAAYTGVGAAISVGSKITEHLISSDTMKEAQKIEEESNKAEKKIQNLFDQMKMEAKKVSPSADSDELDRHVMTTFLGAMAKRSGLEQQISFRVLDNELGSFLNAGPGNMACNRSFFKPEMVLGLAGVLTFFTFQLSGKKSKVLFAKGAEQLIKEISTTGLKTALKGGAMVVGGAVGLAFALPEAIDSWTAQIKNNHVTEASKSLRDTANIIKEISKRLKKQLEEIRQMLQTLAEVKCCIENSNRSSVDKKKLIAFAIKKCADQDVVEWLKENSESEAFFKLVDMFYFLKKDLDKKKKKVDSEEDIDIIFVAHGSIEESMIPASALLPLPTIKDVLLYSPWNCVINAGVAYGIATGRIQTKHRVFSCNRNRGCEIPDYLHQPTNLPNNWNSMKRARGQKIPKIFVSTLKKPEDAAWECFKKLQIKYGEPERNRIVIPFILPIVSRVRVPFFVITLALSLVLYFFGYKATVHLSACLGKASERMRLSERDLMAQYAYTIDKTRMTSSGEMLLDTNSDLYRALRAVFD